MPRKLLRDGQWERIQDLLPGKVGDPGVPGKDNRLFVEAVLWIACAGNPWCDRDPARGKWHAAYTCFSRRGKTGVWQRVIEAISSDRDLKTLFVDSTAVRAHQPAVGTQYKKGGKRSGVRVAG